jgi:hypothetical protein
MPNLDTPRSPKHKGWFLDQKNGRLAAVYNGTELFDFDGNDLTFAAQAVNLASATVTLPTRTAYLNLMPLLGSATGASLLGAETAGSFNYAIGTNQFFLNGEVTQNETETSVGNAIVYLPSDYKSGGTLTVAVVTDIVGSGSLGACTIDVEAFKISKTDGSVGSDLVTTAAQTVNATVAEDTFVITPTGLVAGDALQVQLTSVVIEDMNSNTLTAAVYVFELRYEADK